MLGRTCLYAPWRLGGMIDKVSTVACWIGCVYMHHFGNMNCKNEIEVISQTSSARLHVESSVLTCTNMKIQIIEKLVGNV